MSSNTKEGGILFGTCYDGEALFDLLRHRNEGESISAGSEEDPIWRLTKAYSKADFPDSRNSLGYAVDVFQESIGRTIREYLVTSSTCIRPCRISGSNQSLQTR